MTIDDDTGAHWRPAFGGAFLLFTDPATPPSAPVEDLPLDHRFPHRLLDPASPQAVARDRAVLAVGLGAGLRPRPAPGRPVRRDPGPPAAPRALGVEGLFVNTGYSGHGIMGSPAGSRIVVETVTRALARGTTRSAATGRRPPARARTRCSRWTGPVSARRRPSSGGSRPRGPPARRRARHGEQPREVEVRAAGEADPLEDVAADARSSSSPSRASCGATTARDADSENSADARLQAAVGRLAVNPMPPARALRPGSRRGCCRAVGVAGEQVLPGGLHQQGVQTGLRVEVERRGAAAQRPRTASANSASLPAREGLAPAGRW